MDRRDADAVLAIQRASPESAQWASGDYDLLNRPSTFGWIAEQQERIAGFLILRQILDEAEILNLAVLPEFRRQGIGTALLQAALQDASARGAAQAYLEVRASNKPAMEFYKQHGFRTLGRRAQYYASPVEDALVLGLQLKKT